MHEKLMTEAMSMVEFSSQVFNRVIMTLQTTKTKEMIEASASVGLVLAMTLT